MDCGSPSPPPPPCRMTQCSCLLLQSEPCHGQKPYAPVRSVRCAGLRGATPEGGWSNELKPDDCVHTLVAVQTDEGLTGVGSVFTSDHLVRGALKLLEPLLLGECALEPERVSEKLHPH